MSSSRLALVSRSGADRHLNDSAKRSLEVWLQVGEDGLVGRHVRLSVRKHGADAEADEKRGKNAAIPTQVGMGWADQSRDQSEGARP